ncbi:NUDIX hydrolase [Streptomyces sp. NPDC000983]|uniref:NUDIX hydrolase n=1 Tax=Streptomyces sp. NPDC000983 TaxID=3154373 RepID=UPI003321FD86
MTSQNDSTVQAAGCVLWRHSPVDGALEVCLVHRPKYDDWSHPKGKLKRGEAPLTAALREVAEETGYDATPGPELSSVHYMVGARPKQVRYWAAEAGPGTFTPNTEVDRIVWLRPEAAGRRLTQHRDRSLLEELVIPADRGPRGTRHGSPAGTKTTGCVE